MAYSIVTSDLPLNALLASQDEVIFAYPLEKIWNPKGVSLERRITAAEVSRDSLEAATDPHLIERYIVPVSHQAPTRCIDGRITKGWQPDAAVALGPKIAGGTAHAALAHRIVNTLDVTQNLHFETDILAVIHAYQRIGIGFGGHIDDHQSGSNTGCGAVDNISKILEKLQLPEPQQQLRGLAKIIMGDAYDDAIVNEVIGRMLYLDAVKPRYMPKVNDDPDGEFLYKQNIVATIRAEAAVNDEPVPALHGTHNEIAAILNFADGTTIDTDRYSADHQDALQVFAWDIWEMFEEARRLYPYVMNDSPALQHQAIDKRIRHVTTRTLLGLATVMVLTDGSLRFITVHAVNA